MSLDEHAAQDRERRALGKELHRERDGIAEDVTVDLELHAGTPIDYLLVDGRLILAQHSDPWSRGPDRPRPVHKVVS
ncbi:hypothetical protein FFA01_19280 [Frigoribacterium faeni]|uniref:Uncharacterized protein n=1 Tax=Frigoribacterium faeni TaxID=145483 RepID=A0ABQ0UQ54_9MICO|nr:hypothetical protein GCM10025699_70860 [Microbacterium flavescens]GEK83619.1 hypothetical protein FFA01_19280 [Frigoribacterium faeni]